MDWRQYEKQIYEQFQKKYPKHQILFDQQILGVVKSIDRWTFWSSFGSPMWKALEYSTASVLAVTLMFRRSTI